MPPLAPRRANQPPWGTDCLVVDDWRHETQHHGRYVNRLLGEGLVTDVRDVIELGAVITGLAHGRSRMSDRVVASTVGLGIEDVAAAKTILDKASALAAQNTGEDARHR